MKGYNLWSYAPYRPLLSNKGDIYICRIVPYKNSIHIEWLKSGENEYSVFCRKRDSGDFLLVEKTKNNEFDIDNLETDTDYEFFVESGVCKSCVRLAHTGESVGVVVNYLHPQDEVYSFSGKYLGSPSLVRHPDGFLLSSMDVFAPMHPHNLNMIFRSDDDGQTWHYVSELMPSFWGKMFIHNGELYMLSCSTEYGDLQIGKSIDGGKTFSAPVCLLRGSNGKCDNSGFHKNPQNILIYNGRIYNTCEWGFWDGKVYCHAAMVMSCSVFDDLLVPENWNFTEPKVFNPNDAPELSHLPESTMTIEGTLAVSPEGELFDILRFGGERCAIAYKVNTEDFDAPLEYSHLIPFPANRAKFMIKYDDVSKKYYSIACRLLDGVENSRNLLSLMASDDLKNWYLVKDLIDRSNEDVKKVGFQYVDFMFEGKDIIFLCRTAVNNAHSYHNSNYQTFHRIENFREL